MSGTTARLGALAKASTGISGLDGRLRRADTDAPEDHGRNGGP